MKDTIETIFTNCTDTIGDIDDLIFDPEERNIHSER